MNKYVIFTIGIAIALGLGALCLDAATTHTISSATAAPALLPTNTTTSVTVTAQISDPSLIPNSVNLLQLGSPGTQSVIVGQMQSSGGTAYTIQVPLLPTRPTQFQFQVSAAFKGALQRVLSSVIPVFSVVTPTSGNFTVDSSAIPSGGPLSFTNFGAAYAEGGVVPPNGATINATHIPQPPPPLSNYIDAVELAGATISSTTNVTVSGVSCTQVAYSDTFGAGVTYDGVAVYCPFQNVLYKFYLTYIAGDSNASQYLSALQQVLNSTAF